MLIQIVAGFFSAVAFAYIYHTPVKQLFRCGLVGSIGWLLFLLAAPVWGEIGAMFFASVVVGIISELLARLCKQPVIVFLIPGVIPFVPGGKAYLTMLSFLQNDYAEGVYLLVSTVFLAGAVAAGIIVSSSVFRIYSSTKHVIRR